MSDANRNHAIANAFDRLAQAQNILDRLLADSRRLRADYGIAMRDRYIERAQDALVTVREDFERNVMKVKPTAKLDRDYEKELS